MKHEKALVCLAMATFILSSGEIEVEGITGLLLQVVWSTLCMLICLFSILKLEMNRRGTDD